jgi:hypothetical protein
MMAMRNATLLFAAILMYANPPVRNELRLSARVAQNIGSRLRLYFFHNDGG